MPTVQVKNGQFLNDPDNPSHAHFCHAITAPKSIAKSVDRNMRDDVRQNGTAPRIAYSKAAMSIPPIMLMTTSFDNR